MFPLELVEAISFVHKDGKYTAVLFDPVDNGVSDDMLDAYNQTAARLKAMANSGYESQVFIGENAETAAGETVRAPYTNDSASVYVLIFEEEQARALLEKINESIQEVVGGVA